MIPPEVVSRNPLGTLSKTASEIPSGVDPKMFLRIYSENPPGILLKISPGVLSGISQSDIFGILQGTLSKSSKIWNLVFLNSPEPP